MKGYEEGLVLKDEFYATLRAHQAAVDATKSPQREAAAAARHQEHWRSTHVEDGRRSTFETILTLTGKNAPGAGTASASADTNDSAQEGKAGDIYYKVLLAYLLTY
eukprot:scaffold23165_cov83-Skeletonema_dohrnii-CCMP3373.AAC.5